MKGAFVVLRDARGLLPGQLRRMRYAQAAAEAGFPPLEWRAEGDVLVGLAAATDHPVAPCVARAGAWTLVGSARLDNAAEVAGWVGTDEHAGEGCDLDRVAAVLEAFDLRIVPRLLGDFGFVAWRADDGEIVAVRDAFGGRALYHATHGSLLALASRAALLAEADHDPDFIHDYLRGHAGGDRRTIHRGVAEVQAGCNTHFSAGATRTRRFWSAADFVPDPGLTGPEVHRTFLDLLHTAVRTRLDRGAATWAQLSGGLDSSSVVALALQESLGGRPRLAGTVTFTDSLGDGDEREYVEAVIGGTGLANHVIADAWPLERGVVGPPPTDRPAPQYLFHARDRRMIDVVRGGGGQVLLSGFGSDHYLTGNLYFFADRLMNGELRGTVRELLAWAATGRVSVWTLAREGVLFPLAPTSLRRRLLPPIDRMPPWLREADRGRAGDSPLVSAASAPPGRKYAGAVANSLQEFPVSLDCNHVSDHLDVRYPFLYRPLVEFALRLPPEERTRPFARKWVLREAMRGVLPEKVRVRTTKGGNGGRLAAWFTRRGEEAEHLASEPLLAELGCVDAKALRAAVVAARAGDQANLGHLMLTLSLEFWLRVRSGRWAAEESERSTVSAA